MFYELLLYILIKSVKVKKPTLHSTLNSLLNYNIGLNTTLFDVIRPYLFFALFFLFCNNIIFLLGGETIKQINQQSGAHCELDRRNQNQQQSGGDKTFIIRGDPDQIETAKRIISEKVQMPLNFVSAGVGNNLPTVSRIICFLVFSCFVAVH